MDDVNEKKKLKESSEYNGTFTTPKDTHKNTLVVVTYSIYCLLYQ